LREAAGVSSRGQPGTNPDGRVRLAPPTSAGVSRRPPCSPSSRPLTRSSAFSWMQGRRHRSCRGDAETSKSRKQVSACCAAQTCNARSAGRGVGKGPALLLRRRGAATTTPDQTAPFRSVHHSRTARSRLLVSDLNSEAWAADPTAPPARFPATRTHQLSLVVDREAGSGHEPGVPLNTPPSTKTRKQPCEVPAGPSSQRFCSCS
jgi:hypothetical protein